MAHHSVAFASAEKVSGIVTPPSCVHTSSSWLTIHARIEPQTRGCAIVSKGEKSYSMDYVVLLIVAGKLASYVMHDPRCDVAGVPLCMTVEKCSCGLEQAIIDLEKIEEEVYGV